MLALLPALVLATAVARPVEFSYRGMAAKTVEIAGDFDGWSSALTMTRSGDVWTRSFDLPADARIEYKFVVDGQWSLDPANPNRTLNGLGGENSVWQGTKYRFSIHDAEPKRPLRRWGIPVDGRRIVVYAPANPVGLPVLVYGDGPTYDSPGRVENVAENLVEANKIRPVVIVLVPPLDRLKEYGPDWAAYGRYLFYRVLPAVWEATGASIEPEDVYMGGSSMGGLISLRLAEEFPDKLAGGIQCQSAAIQWRADSLDYNDVAAPANLARIAPTTRIWLDWGRFEDGLTDANVRLVDTLRAHHRSFGYRTTSEGHTWTAWRNRMESGLTYLLCRKH